MTEPLKQMRHLTQALVISGGLNILLLALVLYGVLGDGFLRWRNDMLTHRWPRTDEVVMDKRSKDEAIDQLLVMPFDQLVSTLASNRRLDESVTERDLALGCLVSFYYFNLPHALSEKELPSPNSVTMHGVDVPIYSGLNSEQFSRIMQFAEIEKWPLTSQGLFLALKNNQSQDPTLVEAFWQTPEFLQLQRLFARSNNPVDRTVLLQTVLKGDWSTLERPTTLESFLAAYEVPEEKVAPPIVSIPEPVVERTYIVQEGDSLWKIARKLHVGIKALKEENQLQSDLLRPGRVLKIPGN